MKNKYQTKDTEYGEGYGNGYEKGAEDEEKEIIKIIEKKLDTLMTNPGKEDQIALDNLTDILKKIEKL